MCNRVDRKEAESVLRGRGQKNLSRVRGRRKKSSPLKERVDDLDRDD